MNLFRNRWQLLRVTGQSMRPTLREGQLIMVSRQKQAKVGDVVVAAHPQTGEWLVKRLTNLESGFWLEGDAHQPTSAQTSTDSWVFGPVKEIVGVVIWPKVKSS